jgi:hypothetical protein
MQLERVLSDDGLRKKLCENASVLVGKYDYRVIAAKYTDILARCED